MTILLLDPAAHRTPEALRDFLEKCRQLALARGRPQLASISLEVESLDPLAVLESIFEADEKHFYVERPAEGLAIAGAEAVASMEASGADRFAACQRFVDATLAETVAVGNAALPFFGPHFFVAFTFAAEAEAGEPFPAASVFVPRWQVAQRDGRTVATANIPVTGDAPIGLLAEKVWRAQAKFGAFDYTAPGFAGVGSAPGVAVQSSGAEAYRQTVQQGLDGIAAGRWQKIVLARTKDLTAHGDFHPLWVLNGLRQRFADCFAFSVANGRGQSFIGASPERLVRVRDGELTTEALAGTIGRGATAREDAAIAGAIQRDEKQLREHRLVLDFIAGQLGELGLEPKFSPRPLIRKLPHLQHLHTPVRAGLPAGVRLLDVLSRLHPTPAVGGYPRAAVLPAIRALEGFPRGLYAGAIGWLDGRGGGEFFVGLRSALVDGPRARLYAGNGIVRGSSPEAEWAETELKFRPLEEELGR